MERIDAIYARQSIDKADSISIESQIELCRYEVKGAPCEVFADRGYSGKDLDRPQFQTLLTAVRTGQIRRVICYKLDRCSRSILDFTRLMAEFQTYGVEFVSCTEKFDTGTPMGRAMLSICVVFAQLERETIQQRIRDAYSSRSKRGFYMGGRVPFGFRLASFELEGKRTARYETEEKEAQILRLMYKLYAQPENSLADVVLALRDAGIANPHREDGAWVRAHLGRLLHNPIYVRADLEVYRYFLRNNTQIINQPQDFIGEYGCYLYKNRGQPQLVLAPHEGLVESEIWLRCMAKRKEREVSTQKKTLSSWLTGKVRCDKCGYALVVRQNRRGDHTYRYFVCSRSVGREKLCSGIGCVNANRLEEVIFRELTSFSAGTALPCQTEIDPDRSRMQANCLSLESQINSLVEQSLSASEITKKYLDGKIQSLHRQLLAAFPSFLPEEAIPAERMLADWAQRTISEKKQIFAPWVENIRVSDQLVRILWRL